VKENKITITLNNTNINIVIIKSKRLKRNIHFTFKEKDLIPYLEIKTPYSTSQKEIPKILNSNLNHLEKIFSKFQDSLNNQNLLEKENELLFLGTPLPIDIIKSTQNSFELQEDRVLIKIDFDFTKETKEQLREKLYKQQAYKVITPLLFSWEDKMNLDSNKITYRKTKSQWGSCSTNNNISLNTYLCLLPIEMIEYVIIHELSHIKHKNHSKKFWTLVEKYSPNYKELRHRLKEYGKFLK